MSISKEPVPLSRLFVSNALKKLILMRRTSLLIFHLLAKCSTGKLFEVRNALLLPFLFILVFFYATGAGQDKKPLEVITSIPSSAATVFFKTTPNISVDINGNIYALDNRTSELHIINPFINLEKTIAKKGQGPGELNGPTHLAIDERRIYVLDSYGVSIFSTEGRFENRFRVFHITIDLAVKDEKIYLAQAGSPALINVYDIKGNKAFSFGSKYAVDYEIYKGWSPQLTDSVINTGRILFSSDAIYFVNTIFTDVFKYDYKGNLIYKKRIFPESIIREIENQFLHIGLKKKGAYAYFKDAAFFEGSFYCLGQRKFFGNCPGDILKIRAQDLTIDEAFIFTVDDAWENWRPLNLCLRKGEKGQAQLCVSYYDDKLSDFRISIFQERGAK